MRRQPGMAVTAVTLTATLLAGAPAAGAAVAPHSAHVGANPCSARSVQNNSDIEFLLKGTYNLKVAPAQECANVTRVDQGKTFWAHCKVKNRYNKEWIFGRIGGTWTTGWMSRDNLLKVEGSAYFC
ncbi:hypothetical protein [Nonomuraea ceibae]|uniref:hypothetical protein n=1 Tax=Nonomuraea ceibae TaxID=1935170 RepID=UPI001C60547B|nr:hypothetical protein [Nonomuraea ceibae]